MLLPATPWIWLAIRRLMPNQGYEPIYTEVSVEPGGWIFLVALEAVGLGLAIFGVLRLKTARNK